jgi:hypothetical protein
MEQLHEFSNNIIYVARKRILVQTTIAANERRVRYTIICGYITFLIGFWLIVYGGIYKGWLWITLGSVFFVVGVFFALTKRFESRILEADYV